MRKGIQAEKKEKDDAGYFLKVSKTLDCHGRQPRDAYDLLHGHPYALQSLRLFSFAIGETFDNSAFGQ